MGVPRALHRALAVLSRNKNTLGRASVGCLVSAISTGGVTTCTSKMYSHARCQTNSTEAPNPGRVLKLCVAVTQISLYRGTSLTRKRPPP